MEGSEDDAGNATTDSRRESGRENVMQKTEEVTPGSSGEPESSENKSRCETPAMSSEDNFDGDSVPSPSAQFANTSTEAILEMINELVDDDDDGPSTQPPLDTAVSKTENQVSHNIPVESESVEVFASKDEVTDPPQPCESLNIEDLPVDIDQQCTEQVEVQACSSSAPSIEVEQPVSTMVNQTENSAPVNISCSSVIDSNTSHIIDRTVRCDTSSVNSNIETVVSVESTSSDSVNTTVTRSPLRRRLVRPPRPDTTVSSTVDSQTKDICKDPEPSTSENVTKDVSSSSDAVTSQLEDSSDGPVQDTYISELNVCVPETSVSSPKKIKLIRNKPTPNLNNEPDNRNVQSESEQCQSTSSDAPATFVEQKETSVDSITTSVSNSDEITNEPSTVPLDQASQSIEIPNEPIVSNEIIQQVESTAPRLAAPTDTTSTEDSSPLDTYAAQGQVESPSENCAAQEQVKYQSENRVTQEELESTSENCVAQELVESPSENCVAQELVESPSENCVAQELVESPTENCVAQELVESPSENCVAQELVESSSENCVAQELVESPSENYAAQESLESTSENCPSQEKVEERRVPPIKLQLCPATSSKFEQLREDERDVDTTKQVPKLTIKLGSKPSEEKPSIPKLTIKPIKPPENNRKGNLVECDEQIPNVKKLNIKPIVKPADIDSTHRQSSSSDVSESDSSEIDDNTGKSADSNHRIESIVPKVKIKFGKDNQKSQSKLNTHFESDHSEKEPVPKVTIKLGKPTSEVIEPAATELNSPETIPKVTIKMGKPGTDSEGTFYTEHNIPKLTIKGLQNEEETVSKIVVRKSNTDEGTYETVTKCESPSFTSKSNVKSAKLLDNISIDVDTSENQPIPKLKITQESLSPKENTHYPKRSMKPITKSDSKKCTSKGNEETDNIPVVTKINIKPIIKPVHTEIIENKSEERLPIVSKLNIKPILKPKDAETHDVVEDGPKITKLNIKPLKSPAEQKEFNEKHFVTSDNIPTVSKLNIKPVVRPDENTDESGQHSSETGNSSDDNSDAFPKVTKLNIKPVIKPDTENDTDKSREFGNLPVVTKLNIKPIIKPDEEHYSPDQIPNVKKLNIKPVVKPQDNDISSEITSKNPPLLMKINIKAMTDSIEHCNSTNEHELGNNIDVNIPGPKTYTKAGKTKNHLPDSEELETHVKKPTDSAYEINDIPVQSVKALSKMSNSILESHLKEDLHPALDNELTIKTSGGNYLERLQKEHYDIQKNNIKTDTKVNSLAAERLDSSNQKLNDVLEYKDVNKQNMLEKALHTTSTQGCRLLKQLLEDKSVKHFDNKLNVPKNKVSCDSVTHNDIDKVKEHEENKDHQGTSIVQEGKPDLVKPLEITTSDKITSSGQDSPRIILKINKTEQGTSSKILTEDISSSDNSNTNVETTHELPNKNDMPTLRKAVSGNKKKLPVDLTSPTAPLVKRLRSGAKMVQDPKTPSTIERKTQNVEPKTPSIVEQKTPLTAEQKTPLTADKGTVKRGSPPDITPATQHKASEQLLELEAKRFKLGQLLSNKGLTITPVTPAKDTAPKCPSIFKAEDLSVKPQSNSLKNTENGSKNGSSKLHKILSSLSSKQVQNIAHTETNCKDKSLISNIQTTITSTGSSDVMEVHVPTENCKQKNKVLTNEDCNATSIKSVTEEVTQDILDLTVSTPSKVTNIIPESPEVQTPQPKKRGRPRKVPLPEGQIVETPPTTPLPTPALEERPQRSLRLTRERPAIIAKTPRGRRGRGRGVKRSSPPVESEPTVEAANKFFNKQEEEELDPTSSRVKLPRISALDSCSTPLTSRRLSSVDSPSESDLKVVSDDVRREMVSPEVRGGRGRARGRGRTPRRAKGQFRGGGGRGVVYMKETMGIYGRVCGAATSTVELFEEQTCMMDDNATPSKPLPFMDEDSQSSVKSSTNESSSRMRKSKFVDLFDSNKIWLAADVKEYIWPPPESGQGEPQILMIQEQVAMFLGVKSFKRRYPELKRRNVTGEERDYLLQKGIVTEALCDLGITAVDASEVLDIMLSDFPHKYEEYRTYQRQRQLAEANAVPEVKPESEVKPEVKLDAKEAKPVDVKTEQPKVDPEKLRQEIILQAIQSASEFNARLNSSRAPACVDLQSGVVGVRRPPAPPQAPWPPQHYPLALLPGQYQHTYRYYTPDELYCFPLSTVVSAPPLGPPSPPPSPADSEDSDHDDTEHDNKRKKVIKKRASTCEVPLEEDPATVELCKVCGLREEANRRSSSERFLHCGSCQAKLHPVCSELSADTIRKVREYAWQCAECKVCYGCKLPADDDKMLFCDLCDRGFHIYCVGLQEVPQGRWHCSTCAVCKSCGSVDPAGPPLAAQLTPLTPPPHHWTHHMRKGPKGLQIYSHSHCAPCARANRIGRYCPLCDRSFIGPKGTMQLVICKLCDRQHHQECVRQTVSNLNVLDYTCAECRRGGITSRSAAAKAAPKGIATLFMAKRRFNKYAHRQYMKSRVAPDSSEKVDDTSIDMSMEKADDVSNDKVDDMSIDKVDDMSIDKAEDESMDKIEEPASDPPEVTEEANQMPDDEAASAVKALQMDFGD